MNEVVKRARMSKQMLNHHALSLQVKFERMLEASLVRPIVSWSAKMLRRFKLVCHARLLGEKAAMLF